MDGLLKQGVEAQFRALKASVGAEVNQQTKLSKNEHPDLKIGASIKQAQGKDSSRSGIQPLFTKISFAVWQSSYES